MSTNQDLNKLTPLQKAVVVLKETRAKLNAVEEAKKEPIAIVGMGLRFPGVDGDCSDPEALWELMASGGEAVSEVPSNRWDIDQYFDNDPEVAGKMYTRWGGFLDQREQFDASFFGISPREATNMDPQQRLLLEVSNEALERAGYATDQLVEKSTGVFIGIGVGDYGRMQFQDETAINPYTGTGTGFCFASGRLSYVLQTEGPSFSVDTACSSSLVAAHLACQSLRNRECRMALTGGVNMLLSPKTTVFLSKARALSPNGQCRTFDAAANGFVRGEGCGVLVLKRLSDAQADGDRILALIRGSALNHDGPSSGLTVPNGQAQANLFQQALDNAGVQADQVSYIEAHGTGTSLGDPIELKAIEAVYAKKRDQNQPLTINSIKTNIGHLEAAGGVAGIIKNILSLQKQQCPPHPTFEEPTPHFSWNGSMKVPTELIPWQVPSGSKRLAGVSSFGLSGTNAHLIMEEAPAVAAPERTFERPWHMLTLSGKNAAALKASAARWAEALKHDQPVGDVCFTANRGRSQLNHRLVFLGADTAALQQQLADYAAKPDAPTGFKGEIAPGKRLKTAFLFSGQGSQYLGMGRELYESQPVFRHWLQVCDEALKAHMSTSLLDILFDIDDPASLDQTGHCQPALFALEYALAKTWMSWGIKPDFVMGHSLGEFTAACLAGVFTLEEGLALVAARGRLMQALPSGGKMAFVGADQDTVAPVIAPMADRLSIAALNGPGNTVISGAGEAVDTVLAHFETQGIRCKPLSVSHAFHSPLMTPMLAEFKNVVAGITFKKPTLGFISNLTGKLVSSEVTRADYWVQHILQPVQFQVGMETLNQFHPDLILEIGPQATLLGMGRKCYQEEPQQHTATLWLPSLRPKKSDWRQMLETLAAIFVAGYRIDWDAFDREFQRKPLDLPTYPFQRESYWIAPETQQTRALPSKPGLHPLVQQKLKSPAFQADVQVFESILSADTPDYLEDHRIFGRVVLPGSAYFEMFLATATQLFPNDQIRVGEVILHRPLSLEEEGQTAVQIVVNKREQQHLTMSIYSRDAAAENDPWQLHATGDVSVSDQKASGHAKNPSHFWKPEFEPLNIAAFYAHAKELGVEFGDRFQAIQSLWKDGEFVYSKLALPKMVHKSKRAYHLHPILLDACFQTLGAAFGQQSDEAFLPIGLGSLTLGDVSCSDEWICRARCLPSEAEGMIRADLDLYDPTGQWMAGVADVRFRRANAEIWAAQDTRLDTKHLYQIGWQSQPLQAAAPRAWEQSVFLLVGGTDPVSQNLAREIQSRGGDAIGITFEDFYRVQPQGLSTLNPFSKEDFAKFFNDIQDRIRGKELVILFPSGLADEPHAGERDPLPGISATAAALLHMVQTLSAEMLTESSRLVFLTRGGQYLNHDQHIPALNQVPISALLRTLDLEHPEWATLSLDLDPEKVPDLNLLFAELESSTDEPQIAYRGGERFVAQLVPLEPEGSGGVKPEQPWRLTSERPGMLDSLTLEQQERRQPSADEVEIEVVATGLNFKDVLYAMDMLPQPKSGQPIPFGYECSGIVARVGEGVAHLKPGDEVIAAFTPGSMASYVTLPAHFVTAKPADMRFEEAATLPIVFLTAIYGFQKAGLKKGQRILIHAAAGGVGQAAVQLAQQAGATIFATASRGKHAFLKSMGIDHVYDSRTLDFAEQILADTQGLGVDVVLNSLNGDYIPKNLEVLAHGGSFVEIGKIGIWSSDQMRAAREDVAYYPFDLSTLVQDDTVELRSLLADFAQSLQNQSIAPLPMRVFPLSRSAEAFRYMAQAKHMGKVVISKGGAPQIKDDASYLITGGCGALGLKVAQWTVNRGARHLVLMGRSKPNDKARQVIAEMERSGTSVLTIQADIADPTAMNSLVDRINSDMPPLRGLVHAAGVLEDGLLKNQTWSKFEKVLAPKIAGALNLHRATKHIPLDFFVCFSSASAMLGSPGQANYAYANGFLDAFAQWRQSQGLPCVSLGWGAWAESGMAADLDGHGQARHQSMGLQSIDPDWGMQVLASYLASDVAHFGAFPMDWQRFLGERTKQRSNFFRDLAPQAETSKEITITARLEALEPGERRESLLLFLRDQVAAVLNMNPEQLDTRERLFDLGIDSLMALELKNRLEADFSLRLSQTLVFDYPMVEALADHLSERLPFAFPTQDGPPTTETSPSPEAQQLEELSESEAEALLMRELENLTFES